MIVFLCWSGPKSNALAQFLHTWLRQVIQAVKPWMSDEDIRKGKRWNHEIAQVLDDCRFGLVCLVGDNQKAPWLNFESGALSKHVGDSHVAVLRVDLRSSDVESPLSQFQDTDLNDKNDVLKLMRAINDALGEDALDADQLRESFEVRWPALETKLSEIRSMSHDQPERRSADDMIEEILGLVRSVALDRFDPPPTPPDLTKQAYPAGEVWRILLGMQGYQLVASRRSVEVVIRGGALTRWQLQALYELARESQADIHIQNEGGGVLFTSRPEPGPLLNDASAQGLSAPEQ